MNLTDGSRMAQLNRDWHCSAGGTTSAVVLLVILLRREDDYAAVPHARQLTAGECFTKKTELNGSHG